jgi:hypothetical protein
VGLLETQPRGIGTKIVIRKTLDRGAIADRDREKRIRLKEAVIDEMSVQARPSINDGRRLPIDLQGKANRLDFMTLTSGEPHRPKSAKYLTIQQNSALTTRSMGARGAPFIVLERNREQTGI